MIGRYEGELLTEEAYQEGPSSGAYAMGLSNGKVIDGENPQRSNFLRYMNHSKRKANCASVDEALGPLAAVVIETNRPISEVCAASTLNERHLADHTNDPLATQGEEMLFDYGNEYWDARFPRFSPTRVRVDYF